MAYKKSLIPKSKGTESLKKSLSMGGGVNKCIPPIPCDLFLE